MVRRVIVFVTVARSVSVVVVLQEPKSTSLRSTWPRTDCPNKEIRAHRNGGDEDHLARDLARDCPQPRDDLHYLQRRKPYSSPANDVHHSAFNRPVIRRTTAEIVKYAERTVKETDT
ncbi:hypothetical protein CLAIMM_14221 [Cladophialophora immunda]|nr:hypothetical protein CLAIMM_14221 [Cladophialophora immunda]